MKTVRLTMAQALVRFLENQYIEVDGEQSRFVRGVFIIPGHGNVVGLGQALSQEAKHLEIWHGQNEQGMAQAAVAFAKQMKRKQICVATSSVGPGAANMVTACGTATANNIPVLVLPGDVYACRRVRNSKVANVFSDRLADVWVCQMERYRDYTRFEKCSKCKLLAFCRGCPAVASGRNGDFYAADPQCWKQIEGYAQKAIG